MAARRLLSNLAPKGNAVRPTSGLEFVSSRHFPDEVQGDMLLCNTIGFLGIKQHPIEDDGTGYKTAFRQDLLKSSDGNFRPVDLEFAPDGSLYVDRLAQRPHRPHAAQCARSAPRPRRTAGSIASPIRPARW